MDAAELKNNFGFSLLRKLCKEEKGNFVFSPLSLGTALAMLTAGLHGDTKTELLKLFGTFDESELHSMYTELLSKEDLPLKTANKFLADQDCKVHKSFDTLLKAKYDSKVECVNFAKNGRKIEADVNAWVSKRTNDMISKLLPEGTLNQDTVLVLLNAIYFKGTWFKEFDSVPEPMNFNLRNGEKVPRKFIKNSAKQFGYNETDKLRLVKLPYREAGFYMVVAIPKDENEHIDEVLAETQAKDFIGAVKASTSWRKVVLSMPKFKIEYTFGTVQESLKELGVNKIFVPSVGGFGNLFRKVKRSPYVGAIVHKAVIEVDEKGTEAAAFTGFFISLMCANVPPPPVIVELNRPFCFFIMSSDDTVCFAGICADPQEK